MAAQEAGPASDEDACTAVIAAGLSRLDRVMACRITRAAMRVAILMPSYNEGERLGTTLQSLASQVRGTALRLHVFVVDDGGAMAVCPERMPMDEEALVLTVMRHPINLGQGAAIETARQRAIAKGPFDAYVTMDADGQHAPEDLQSFCEQIRSGADVVFGNRFAGSSNVPAPRKLVLIVARLFERMITGLALADAHNGYRAFSGKGIRAVALSQARMAHATEIKQHIAARKHDLVIREVPVSIRYSSEALQKGQSSLGALQILADLFYGYVFGGSRR